MPGKRPHLFYQLARTQNRTGNDSTLSIDKLRSRMRHDVRAPARRVLKIWRCKAVVDIKDEIPLARERSEEHTSELQSRENLVCRLLLERKKIINRRTTDDNQ